MACTAAPTAPGLPTPSPVASSSPTESAVPSPAVGTPTPPAITGQIVLTVNESIVVIDLATGTAQTLGGGAFPAWSPDGTRIAFSRAGATDLELWVMDADGTGQQKIGIGFGPRWSPDGSRIAFNGDPIDLGSLWVVNADGTGAARLSPTGGRSPSWSPDGARLAFERAKPGSGGARPELAIIGVDGSDPHGLADAVDPDWSPDGRWIAASAWSEPALLLIDPDAGASSTPVRLPGGGNVPAWSPDGSRIAFVSGGDLYVATLGGGWERITTGLPVFPRPPAWSPDGTWLAFTVSAGEPPVMDIFVVGSEGQGPGRLTTSGGASDPDWRPALP